MSKIDIEKFNESLRFAGEWQGDRPAKCRNSDGDIIATATSLISHAHSKPLYPKDIEIVLNAVVKETGMVEAYPPMAARASCVPAKPPPPRSPKEPEMKPTKYASRWWVIKAIVRDMLCWVLFHKHETSGGGFSIYCTRCGEHITEHLPWSQH
ncbi:MAG: hypothetical protein ACSLE8_06335 [Rhodococcus sp. (in: high G+C Gram-positive bacteria)]